MKDLRQEIEEKYLTPARERGVKVGSAVKGTAYFNVGESGIVEAIDDYGVATVDGRRSHVDHLTGFFEPFPPEDESGEEPK